jgi:hypothetical protein
VSDQHRIACQARERLSCDGIFPATMSLSGAHADIAGAVDPQARVRYPCRLFGNETRGSNRNVAIRFESMLDSQDDDRHQINHKLGLTLVCLASLNPLPLFALRRFNTNEAVPIEVFVPATSRIQGNRVNRGVYAKSLNTYRDCRCARMHPRRPSRRNARPAPSHVASERTTALI